MSWSNQGESDITIPATVLNRLIRDVWDPLEMKIVLAVSGLGGEQEPVSIKHLVSLQELQRGARGDGSARAANERIEEAVNAAAAHGTLITLVDVDGSVWLVLATEANYRRAQAKQFSVPEGGSEPVLTVERPGVFRMYEQNIGLVTPIIADKLADALQQYPAAWIEDAISEAVTYNRRNWRYVERILENWSTEGRGHETNQRDHEEHVNPGTNLLGRYAPLFRKR